MDFIEYEDLTKELDVVHNTALREAKADYAATIMHIRPIESLNYTVKLAHGLRGLQGVGEDGEFPSVKGKSGFKKTYEVNELGGKFSITKKIMLGWREENGSVKDSVRNITKSMYEDMDQLAADIFTNGFSTTFKSFGGSVDVDAACPNGKPLFSATHGNAVNNDVFSNIITDSSGTSNPAMSRDAIVTTRAKALKHRDPRPDGNKLVKPVILDTVLCGPDLEDEANRILFSDKVSGGDDNDTNKTLKGLKLAVWPRLAADSQGVAHPKKWFMLDSKNIAESVHLISRQKPTMYTPVKTEKNETLIYKFDAYVGIAYKWPAFVYGSTGEN